jgi:hypothetical protein
MGCLSSNNHNGTAAVLDRIAQARDYFHNTVMTEDRYESVRTLCRNLNDVRFGRSGRMRTIPCLYTSELCAVCFREEMHVMPSADPDTAECVMGGR